MSEPAEGALGAYLNAIRAHKLLVILITLAAVAASIGVILIRTPQYEATAQVLVVPVPPDDPTFVGLPVIKADPGDPARTIQTAVSLVDSQVAADLAAETLGGDWTADRVLDATQVEPQGDSDLLVVTATADDSDEAVKVANVFVRSSLEVRSDELRRVGQIRIDQLQARVDALPQADQAARAEFSSRLDQIEFALQRGDPTLSLSQEAISDDMPTGTPAVLIIALAALAGFMLGSGTAMLLELVNRRVRDEEEILRHYQLPVLARLPLLAQRSRQRPIGSNWYVPPGIREPFRTLAVQLEQLGGGSRVVMLTSPTRGDGKTTSAINLAVTLAATGKSVILLDLDLRNPQIARSLGMDEGLRLSALVDPQLDVETLLVHPSELRTFRVLPVILDAEESHLIDAVGWRLPQIIEQASTLADYVIVDTPPIGEVSDALSLAPLVDNILVVVRPGNTSRSHLAAMRELLERTQLHPEGCIVIGGTDRVGRGYYGYGAGSAPDLVLRAAGSGSNGPPESGQADVLRTE